jgi:hypothetical protein
MIQSSGGELDISVGHLIAYLGGWTVLISGLSSWLNKILTERLLSKWRRDETAAIESLKGQLSNERLLLETAIKGSQLGQDTSHQKRLSAVDRLWKALLQIRSDFSVVVLFFEILLPNEYDEVLKKKDGLSESLRNIDSQWIAEKLAVVEELEIERPYLGEGLWTKLAIYRSFLGRLAVLIQFGKEGKPMRDWQQDKGARSLLAVVLPDSSIKSLDKSDVFALRKIIVTLESLVLEEISLILSGKRSAAESFASAKDLNEALAAATSPQPAR